MTKPVIKFHDVETGEIVEREMNADELKQWELDKAEAQAKIDYELAKAAEKTALLSKLGISEDEAKLLLS